MKKCNFFIDFQNDRDIGKLTQPNSWYIHQKQNTKKIFWNKKNFWSDFVLMKISLFWISLEKTQTEKKPDQILRFFVVFQNDRDIVH